MNLLEKREAALKYLGPKWQCHEDYSRRSYPHHPRVSSVFNTGASLRWISPVEPQVQEGAFTRFVMRLFHAAFD